MKSQKLSCAVWAWGKPRSGSSLAEWDQVRELDGVLNEEHWNVIADNVPVALLRVDFDGEAADVTGEVGRALIAGRR